MILEDDNFKIVVGQTDAARNLKIPAIVSYPRNESEAGAILRAIHRQMKARNGSAELPEATMPVGQLAQFPLQIQIEFIDNARIEPHSSHKNEMAARLVRPVERAQRDAHRRRV